MENDIKNSIFAMSTIDKLINRFRSIPSDFTFEELVRLLNHYGYVLENKGKTSGSRIVFIGSKDKIIMHKPHPACVVKKASVKAILKYLITNKQM